MSCEALSSHQDRVEQCSMCQSQRSTPPWSWPWSRIHIDFAGPMLGFLIVIDAHSKWLEVVATTRCFGAELSSCLHQGVNSAKICFCIGGGGITTRVPQIKHPSCVENSDFLCSNGLSCLSSHVPGQPSCVNL